MNVWLYWKLLLFSLQVDSRVYVTKYVYYYAPQLL